MNLKSLRVFTLIMKHGTLARASDLLHLSPPAVSRLLRMLEEEMGQTLFDRVKKRLVATSAAEQLYPEALRILASLDGLPEFLKQHGGGVHAPLRLICHPRASHGLMLPAIRLLNQRHPDARILLEVHPRKNIGSYIAQDQFHIGVGSLPVPAEGIRTDLLCETSLGVLVRRDNPLTARKGLTLADLKGENYVALTEGTLVRQLVDAELIRANRVLHPAHEVSVSTAAHQMVVDGTGFTFSEEVALGEDMHPDLRLIPLRPQIRLKMGLYRPSEDRAHPLLQAMSDCLQEVADRLSGNDGSSKLLTNSEVNSNS